MNTYFKTFADEILSKFERINKLISHSASIGSYRETLVRHYLSNFLSKRYSVKTGFVYDPMESDCSRQTDILIIDENHTAPFLFSDNDFVIARPESVVLGIEVKSSLNKVSFIQSIENCLSFKKIIPSCQFFVFAFEGSVNLKSLSNGWYKEIDSANDKIELYPNSIYCMNIGKFGIVPPKYSTTWGHYSITPSDKDISPESMIMSLFLADIVKNIDLSKGDDSNPYSAFGNLPLIVEHNCLRFGKGEIAGEIIK